MKKVLNPNGSNYDNFITDRMRCKNTAAKRSGRCYQQATETAEVTTEQNADEQTTDVQTSENQASAVTASDGLVFVDQDGIKVSAPALRI